MSSLEDRKAELRVKRREILERIVKDAKEGVAYDYRFKQFDLELRFADMTLDDLGITQEDVDHFAHLWNVEYVRKNLSGIEDTTCGVNSAKYFIEIGNVTYEEAGISPDELIKRWGEEGIQNATESLEKCRIGVFEHSGNRAELWLNGLLYELEEYELQLENIGSSTEEIESFKRPDAIALCRHLIDEIEKTNTDYWSWQDAGWGLLRLMKTYNIAPADINVPKGKIEQLATTVGLEFMTSWTKFVSYGDGRLSDMDVITSVVQPETFRMSAEELNILKAAEEVLLRHAEDFGIEE
jgi:hypothetical protein